MDRLTAVSVTEARAFHSTFRFIDDVLSIDNPFWEKYVGKPFEEGGIYPKALTLNNTSLSNKEVTFLGMHIFECNGSLELDVFDKRKEFPFAVRRYPQMCSLIPQSIPYGVFVGQLTRYYRVCTQTGFFVENARILALTLITQGCKKSRIVKCFRSFLSKFQRLRWRDASVNGMCKVFERLVGSYG
jgi:hypothetical protein